MKLSDKQKHFMSLLPRLLDKIYDEGYACTAGDAYRDPRATFPYSHPNSLHTKRLAIDLLIFDDAGNYLTATEDYRFAGEYWMSLDPACCWGGVDNKDGGHFSMYADDFGMVY